MRTRIGMIAMAVVGFAAGASVHGLLAAQSRAPESLRDRMKPRTLRGFVFVTQESDLAAFAKMRSSTCNLSDVHSVCFEAERLGWNSALDYAARMLSVEPFRSTPYTGATVADALPFAKLAPHE